MGSSALTVQGEVFQTNVTPRFGIDDEHDPGEGKVERVERSGWRGVVG
jgi:hypothetical protein